MATAGWGPVGPGTLPVGILSLPRCHPQLHADVPLPAGALMALAAPERGGEQPPDGITGFLPGLC